MTCLGRYRGQRYNSNPFAPHCWKEVHGQHHTLATLPYEVPNTYCTGSWVGLGASLDGTTNLMPTGT